jgi:DNA-binding IclR family transcriptional regulator
MALQYLNDLAGIPQSFEEVSNHLASRARMPVEAQAHRALNYLDAAGYIERCEHTAADDPAWKITAKGIRMAERQVPSNELDPMIWG